MYSIHLSVSFTSQFKYEINTQMHTYLETCTSNSIGNVLKSIISIYHHVRWTKQNDGTLKLILGKYSRTCGNSALTAALTYALTDCDDNTRSPVK